MIPHQTYNKSMRLLSFHQLSYILLIFMMMFHTVAANRLVVRSPGSVHLQKEVRTDRRRLRRRPSDDQVREVTGQQWNVDKELWERVRERKKTRNTNKSRVKELRNWKRTRRKKNYITPHDFGICARCSFFFFYVRRRTRTYLLLFSCSFSFFAAYI